MLLREDARTALLSAGTRVRYRPGARIYAPGDPPGPVMIVLSGEVDVVESVGSTITTTQVRSGELFGEESAIDGLPRGTAAVARDAVEVAAIDPLWFEILLTEIQGLAVDLLRDLGGRMRQVTERVGATSSRRPRRVEHRHASRIITEA